MRGQQDFQKRVMRKFLTVAVRWAAVSFCLTIFNQVDGITWRFDGFRYIQEVDVEVDGEWWSNYEPVPPADYLWPQFMTFSHDAYNRHRGKHWMRATGVQHELLEDAVDVMDTRLPVPGWTFNGREYLSAEGVVDNTMGDTSTLHEIHHGLGWGEWSGRSRYDDREGHPYLEFIRESSDDCVHPFAGNCQNGATCYDYYTDYFCHCMPGFSGKNCEIGETDPQPEIPPRWRCLPGYVGNGDGCDCDCGGWDPDCDDTTQPVINCKPAETCMQKQTMNDTYGMCVYSADESPRKFRPRFTPGITFGVAFSEDKEGTYLGAFDTTTGQIYHIRDFPYSGPNPTYGNSVYDFKNQVFYTLVDRIHDANLETRLIGINVETSVMVVDLVFDFQISSVQYDQIDGAMYFVALEDQNERSSLVRFNLTSHALERVNLTTAFCPENSVVEDPTCEFNVTTYFETDNATNITTNWTEIETLDYGIQEGNTLNLKHYEHTYGMAVLDKVNHTYYVTIRLTPHVNGLLEVSTRTGTVRGLTWLPHEITSIDMNPQFNEHRHSYQELHDEVHLRAPLVGFAGPRTLDSSPLTTDVVSQNKLYYIDTRNKTEAVLAAAPLYGDQESQLFLGAYDTVRNNEYGIFDNEFAHSLIATTKADLQGQERAGASKQGQNHKIQSILFQDFDRASQEHEHYIAESLQNPDGFVSMMVSQYPFITEIRPWAGPTWGNTTVNVSGLNFFASDRIECRFGPITVDGAFDPLSRTIACIAPPQPPSKVTFELSLYGDGFTGNSTVAERITNQVRYDYYQEENATWLVPAMGPLYGNTSTIMTGLAHYANATAPEHRCKFNDLEVDGVYLTDEISQCWVPPESALEDFHNCTRYCVWHNRHKPFAQDDSDLCVSKCVFGGGVAFGEFGYPHGYRNETWPYDLVPGVDDAYRMTHFTIGELGVGLRPMKWSAITDEQAQAFLVSDAFQALNSSNSTNFTETPAMSGRRLQKMMREYGRAKEARRLQTATCLPVVPTVASHGPGVVAGTCNQVGFEGSMCVLGCGPGYEALSNVPAICSVVNETTGEAEWSGSLISCAVSCGEPEEAENAEVQWSARTEGATANYICNEPDWELPPVEAVYSCRNSGLWQSNFNDMATPPECLNSTIMDQLRYEAELLFNMSRNNTNSTNASGCYTEPLVCYRSEEAYEQALEAERLANEIAANLTHTGNLTIGNTSYDAAFHSSLGDADTLVGPDCSPGDIIAVFAPDGESYDMTGEIGSVMAASFNYMDTIYDGCTTFDSLYPGAEWGYIQAYDDDGVLVDDCMDITHQCLWAFCGECPEPLQQPSEEPGSPFIVTGQLIANENCANISNITNSTNSSETSCGGCGCISAFCTGGKEICPINLTMTEEEKQVNGSELIDFLVDNLEERIMSTRAIVMYFPDKSRPALLFRSTSQEEFVNAIIDVISTMEYMNPTTGIAGQVGPENVYVLQVAMVGSTPVTTFDPEIHKKECAWTDIYCEKFIPDDLLPPEPEPEPEPEPMYVPEPEEEPFEFDPGDPDMPRCIPCYIRWWNTYYAPVGYPFLLWARNARRMLSETAEIMADTARTIFGGGTETSRRNLAEDLIQGVCEEGYTGDRCEWLLEYPEFRPPSASEGFEVIIAFDEYIDPGQMYHNILVNMTDPVTGAYNPTGLTAKFEEYTMPSGSGFGSVPYPMFATAEDLGFDRNQVRMRIIDALLHFGDQCFDLCSPRDSCYDLCADPHYVYLHKHPRMVVNPERSCSLINTSNALLDYGVLCDGMLNEAVMGLPENRSRIYYSYDRFEDIRGPLLLTTNGTIAYEDPTVQQVIEQAYLPDVTCEFGSRKEWLWEPQTHSCVTLRGAFIETLHGVFAQLFSDQYDTMQVNGSIQKERAFNGHMLSVIQDAHWYTRTNTRYYVHPEVYEVLGPQAFDPVRTHAVRFSFANNGQQFTIEGPRFFYYDAPVVHRMAPSLGPDYGDTFITMDGANFIEGPGLLCLFDDWDPFGPDIKMNSTFIWPWELNCISPPHDLSIEPLDYVYVEASNNDQQYTRERIIFDYYPAPNVTAVLPSTAPKRGNTLITVSGIKFLPRTLHYETITRCRFGGPEWPINEYTEAVYLDENTMQCFTPETEAGTFDIDITLNGQQYTNSHVKFTFFGIDYLYPPLGPQSGGTLVSVFGKGFTDTGQIRCLFGLMPVDGIYVSYYEIQCLAPAAIIENEIDRAVAFEITFYMAEWTQSGKNFTYYDDAYIFAVAPAIEGVGLGPNWGGTYLRIEGANFVNHWAELNRCKFSRKDLLGVEGNDTTPDYIVDAMFVSKTIMYCYAPHYYLTSCNALYCEDEDVKVTITYNNQQYTSAMSATERRYIYYPQLKVETLSPDNGPHKEDFKFGQFIRSAGPLVPPRYYASIKGHTTVNIIGDNFKPPPGLIEKTFCRWDNITVAAETIYSRNRMTCTTDDVAEPGKYMLQVTRNGQDWTEEGPDFHFYGAYNEDPSYVPQRRITNFVPRSGYIEGHTKVLMLGTEFVNSTQIRTWFGQHPPIPDEYLLFNASDEKWETTDWQTKGLEPYKDVYIASTMVQTVAPEHKATGNLDVIMTSNEQEWTLADITFYFSRTYAHASRTYLHTDPGVVGLTKKFLIEARSKEGETMTEGGDFFYVDLWGGDTYVRDTGEPFHYSSLPRDDRIGNEQVNITDNRWNPLNIEEDVPGTYWAIYYTTSSGVYYVEVMISGDQIGDAPFHVAIHPDVTYPPNCFAIPGYSYQADGLVEMQAGIAALLHIQMRDKFGNNRTMNPSTEEIGLSIENTPSRATLVINMEDGTYDVWWVSIYLGYYQVNVSIADPMNPLIVSDPGAPQLDAGPSAMVGKFWDWRAIGMFPLYGQLPLPYVEDEMDWWDTLELLQPAPWTTQCKPGEPSTFGCIVTGDGRMWATAGVPSDIMIDAKDLFGNNVWEGGADFMWTMEGFSGELISYTGYAHDHNDGTYGINYTALVSSQPNMTSRMLYAFSVYLKGSWGTYRHLSGSPFFKVYVYPGPSYGPNCYAVGDGILDAVAGRSAEFRIYPRDRYMNHKQFGQNESVVVSLVIDGEVTHFPVVNCPNCIEGHLLWGEKPEGEFPFHHIANYEPGRSGFHFLKVEVNGEHIAESPFYITIPPPWPKIGHVVPMSGPVFGNTVITLAVEYENQTDYFKWLSVLETVIPKDEKYRPPVLNDTRRLEEVELDMHSTNATNVTSGSCVDARFTTKIACTTQGTWESEQAVCSVGEGGREVSQDVCESEVSAWLGAEVEPATIYTMYFRFYSEAAKVESDFVGYLDASTGLMHVAVDAEVFSNSQLGDPCEGIFPGKGGEFCTQFNQSTWHETIDTSSYDINDVCTVFTYTRDSSCEEFCTNQGRTCKHAQRSLVEVNASVCTVHPAHDAQDTGANGCNQRWPSMLCGCGPPPRLSYYDTILMQRTYRQDFSQISGFTYTFYDPRVIESAGIRLHPPIGPTYGETKVTILSEGLFDSGQASCKFGAVEVPAPAAGVCSDPVATTAEACAVLGTCTDAAFDNEADCIVAGECIFEEAVVDIAVTSQMCDQIDGSQWNAEIWTPADETWTIKQPIELQCKSPNASSATNASLNDPGQAVYNTTVYFALNGQQYQEVSATFLYYEPAIVNTIDPHSGPIAGGTTMTLTGSNIWETGMIACRHGAAGAVSPGTVVWEGDAVTANEIAEMPVLERWALAEQRAEQHYFDPDPGNRHVQCLSSGESSVYGPGELVTVEIALNGQQFSISDDKDNFFTFYDTIVVGSVVPSYGPVTGGVEVILTPKAGTGFPTFDPEETNCVFIQDDVDPPVIKYVPAIYSVQAGAVTCLTPDWDLAGHVRVEVAMNGQQPSVSDVMFAYTAVVSGLSHHYGPFAGDTTVIVHGLGFVDTSLSRRVGARMQVLSLGDARCLFYDSGMIDPDCSQCETMITYINSTAVICNSPDYSNRAMANGNYDPNFINYWEVRVIMDKCFSDECFGNHSSGPADINNLFGFYEVPQVTNVMPPDGELPVYLSGPVAGGAPLVLTGILIHPMTADVLPVRCGFFGEYGFYSSPATEIRLPAGGQSGEIHCSSPAVDLPQDARIGLALNGQQYTAEVNIFNFYDPDSPPEVTSVNPESGSMYGGTTITIRGNNFANLPDLACRLDGKMARDQNLATLMNEGETHPQNPDLTLNYQTSFVSSHEISCVTQPHYELRRGFPGWQAMDTTPDPTNLILSKVDVTNGGTDQYSTTSAEYSFIETLLTQSVVFAPFDGVFMPQENNPMPRNFDIATVAGEVTNFMIESRDAEAEKLDNGGEFFASQLTQVCTDAHCRNGEPAVVWFTSIDLDPAENSERPEDAEFPGYYLLPVTLSVRGTYTMDVQNGGESLISAPFAVTVAYGQACASTSTFSGPGMNGFQVSDTATVSIEIISRDCYGNMRSEDVDDPFLFMAVLTPTLENEQYNYPMAVLMDNFQGAVTAETGGVYNVDFGHTKAGEYEVRVTLNLGGGIVGDHLQGSPFSMFVDPEPMNPTSCSAQGTDDLGYGRDMIHAGVDGLFKIIARDRFTNARLTGGALFNATLSAGQVDSWYDDYLVGSLEMQALGVEVGPAFVECKIVDMGDSSYDATYRLTLAGEFRLEIWDFETGTNIAGSPFITTVLPGDTYFPYCRMTGRGTTGSVAGQLSELFVSSKDEFYNDRTEIGSDNFTMFIEGAEEGYNTQLQTAYRFDSRGPGLYNTSYLITVAGDYYLYVQDYRTLKNIAGSPSIIFVEPAETIAATSSATGLIGGIAVKAGDWSAFLIEPRDVFGNSQMYTESLLDGFKLTFEAYTKIPSFWYDSINVPYEYSLVANRNGTITVEYVIRPMQADYNVHVQYLGTEIIGSPDIIMAMPLDPPKLILAKFYDELIRIRVVFDRPTNRANMAKDASCNEIFTDATEEKLGEGALCNWLDASELTISLGFLPNITIGSVLELRTDGKYNRGVLTELANSYPATGSAKIAISDEKPYVEAIIKGPLTVGTCDTLIIDASLSFGAGLAPLDYNWYATEAKDQLLISKFPPMAFSTYVALQARLEGNGDKIMLEADDLVAETLYGVSVEVQNFVGYADKAYWNFTKIMKSIPIIQLAGDSDIQTKSSKDLVLAGDAVLPTIDCLPIDDPARLTDKKLGFRWVQVGSSDPGEIVVTLSAKTQEAKKTIVPAGSLVAGETYRFQLQAYQISDPDLNNTADVFVTVEPGSLASVIAGGNRQVASSEPLVLDASESYDEDNTLEPLRYTWQCLDAVGEECIDGSASYSSFKFHLIEDVGLRTWDCCVQMAEIVLYDSAGAYVEGGSTSNPDGSNPSTAGHANAYNGIADPGAAKWLDFNFGDLIITFEEPVAVQSYDWMTGDDEPGRDPVMWELSGSNTGGIAWTVIDATHAEFSEEISEDRLTWTGPWAIPGVQLMPYPTTSEEPTITVPANALCSVEAVDKNPGCGTYSFHLIVSKLFTPQGEENPRSATSSATITVVGSKPPTVVIDWQTNKLNKILMKQNEADALRMVGQVSEPDEGSSIATKWYMTAGDLIDAEGSLDDLRDDGRLKTERTDINMVIGAYVLTPGAHYTFVLQAVDSASGAVGQAEISIKCNTPPAGGGFWVQPESGIALDTYFYLNASMWGDEADDYPITYAFKYVADGKETPIGDVTELNYRSGVTFAKPEEVYDADSDTTVSGLTVIVDVTDALNAPARRTRIVQLTEGADTPTTAGSGRRLSEDEVSYNCLTTLEAKFDSKIAPADKTGSVDESKYLVSTYASVLAKCASTMTQDRRRRMLESDYLDYHVRVGNLHSRFLSETNYEGVGYGSDNATAVEAPLDPMEYESVFRGKMMETLASAAGLSEMTSSAVAQNGAALEVLTNVPELLNESTIDLGATLISDSLRDAALGVDVGTQFASALSQTYEGKRYRSPVMALENCPFQNGTLHEYKCNKSNPIGGITLQPCVVLDVSTIDPYQIEQALLDAGDCCSHVLNGDEADILCQDEAARTTGADRSVFQESAQFLVSSLITENVKNEDGVMISTKELELIGTVTDAASFGNLSLGRSTMPLHMQGDTNKSTPAFRMPPDILSGAENVTGKVDVRVVNYNRNPYDWSLIQDSEVVGAVTSLTIASTSTTPGSSMEEVPIEDLLTPIVITIPIKRPREPNVYGMNYTGMNFEALNSTTADAGMSGFNASDIWWNPEVGETDDWFGNVTENWPGMPTPAEMHNESCKYWDERYHVWTDRGCETVSITPTLVTCQCYHLTDFSVLLDEFKPDLSMNVIDPFGDAALIANINPENMFPLLLVLGLYILYATLCFMSKRKDASDRKLATRYKMEDVDEMPDEEPDDTPLSRGAMMAKQFGEAIKNEHSVIGIATVAYDDEFTRCMRLTIIFCSILGTYATDAAFNAGDAGGDTIGAMATTAAAVTVIMYPVDLLFVYMFTKVGPTAKRMSDAKTDRLDSVDKPVKPKKKPRNKKPPVQRRRTKGPDKPRSSQRMPPKRRANVIARNRRKLKQSSRHAVPQPIDDVASRIQGAWRGFMVRKYLGQRLSGNGPERSNHVPPPPPETERGNLPRSRPRARVRGVNVPSGGMSSDSGADNFIPLPRDAPRRPRPRGRSVKGQAASYLAADPPSPPKQSGARSRPRPRGRTVRGRPSAGAPLGVPPPPPPMKGAPRPTRRKQKAAWRDSSASDMGSESEFGSDRSNGEAPQSPPPPPPPGMGGSSSGGGSSGRDGRRPARRSATGGRSRWRQTPSAGAPPPPPPLSGTRPRRNRGGARRGEAVPSGIPPPPPPPGSGGSAVRPLPRSDGRGTLQHGRSFMMDAGDLPNAFAAAPSGRARRPPSVYSAPNPPPPPPPPPAAAAEIDVRRPRRRGLAGRGSGSSGGETLSTDDDWRSGVVDRGRRPVRRRNRAQRSADAPPPPPPPPR
eukprot:SAG11_NODE_35_length_22255_cov_14.517422_2_plen_6902_part_00